MLFSRACEYGIRAVLFLADRKPDAPVLVRDIAEAIHIPSPFLSKIVQTLSKEGLLISQKGPGGGVSLARSTEEIKIIDVVAAIDGLEMTKSCVLGMPDCSEISPCPLHERWGAIRNEIVEMLSSRSVAEFVDQLARDGHVLTRRE